MQTLMRPAMSGYLSHHRQQLQTQNHQPVQQQLAFDQDMSAQQPSAPLEPAREGYEWEQETGFCPSSMNPALSLDMLLGMGPSQTAVPIAASPSQGMLEEEQNMYDLARSQQQQHSLSSIPLVSFANEYPAASLDSATAPMDPYKQQEIAMSLSSIPSSPAVSVSMSQHQQLPAVASLPQQYYYELLMAANPNQPLSQLLSSSATAMASQPFTVTSSSIPASPDMPPAYSVLDTSAPVMVSSSSIPDGTSVDSSNGLLGSVAPTYAIESFPVDSSSSTLGSQQQQQQQQEQQQQQQQQQQEQQTLPLTTKDIMDALSGQFPIQPVTPSAEPIAMDSTELSNAEAQQESNVDDEMEPSVLSMVSGSSPVSSVSSTPVATSLQDPTAVPTATQSVDSVECLNSSKSATPDSAISVAMDSSSTEATPVAAMEIASETLPQPQGKQEEQRSEDNDCYMMSPPALCHHEEEKMQLGAILAAMEDKAADNSQEQHAVADMDMDMTSPPPSPTRTVRLSKRNSKGSSSTITRRTSSSRPQTRRSRTKTEPENPVSMEPHATDSVNHADDMEGGSRASRASKRRRGSVDDMATPSATSSACSSPESSPPSPKTPPPLSDNQNAVVHHQVSATGQDDQDHVLHHKHALESSAFDDDAEPPKRCKSQRGSTCTAVETSENDMAGTLTTTAMAVADSENTKKEGSEDAGVLSPSLLTRYATRHSTRILRRTASATAATESTAPVTGPSGRKASSVTSTSCASVSGSEPGLLNNSGSRKATAA
ncbi:hypothetical protein B0O80DRAFT_138019 [Mortierella sp. GBAus27b]|nr:hypothetical protein B0O80DRAFT_138019 [Mortierella sp. GBAus27b]